jgi:small nuclear ribonucleoprotein (snRNP)-like protein
MQSKQTIVSLALAVSLIVSAIAPAAFAQQTATRGWNTLQSLKADELSIKLKDGKSVRGEFYSVNDSELTILRKGKQQVVARDVVAQIELLERKAEKGKYAAIGAGIGAGTGLGIGLAKNSPPVDDGGIYPVVGTALGAGIGAIGGFLFGQAKRKRVLIYQAP